MTTNTTNTTALTANNATNELTAASFSAEYFNGFINYIDAAPKTVETYTKSLKQFAYYLQANGITQPSRADILAYKEQLQATGHKPSTVQNYIIAVRVFFNWLHQEGYYPNIAEHIKGAKIDRSHKKDYLTGNQVKAVLGSISTDTAQSKRDYAILALMISCGLRTIEVVRANIEDIRPAGEATALYIQGKGHEEKTEYIKLPAAVETAIRAYLATRGNAEPAEPLFTGTSNRSKNGRLSTRSISGICKAHLQAAGFNSDKLTAHSLRHTAVTLSLLAGKDITEVQQFARHANIATTMIYNHALDQAKNGCSEAIAAAIF